jgi:nucleotide-binding universal stress UspA family protein
MWYGEENLMPETYSFSTIPAKILLPIDFSPSSHVAIEQATVLAQHFHAELVLVYVADENCDVEASKKLAEANFATSVAALAAKGVKAESCVVSDADVAGAILEVGEKEHADMLIVSTHGTTGWHPLVFGSIAEKLVKLAHVPVLLLRTEKPVSSARVSSGRLMEWW